MPRYCWVDRAKAIGMFLVYYGHIAENLDEAGVDSAFLYFKLIYAFHMPLFFVMAGFFARTEPLTVPRFTRLARRRLLPVLAFGALLLPLWPVHLFLWTGHVSWLDLAWRGLDYLHGTPRLNWITWFLVCLFACEVYAGFSLHLLGSRLRIAIFGVVTLLCGLLICHHLPTVERLFGIRKNTWFIHEGLVALGFYSLGHAVFPFLQRVRHSNRISQWALLTVSAGLLWSTFRLNAPQEGFVAMMATSEHGYTGPFLAAAFAGVASVIALAMILPAFRVAEYLGRNTLILLGLSGLLDAFVTPRLVLRIAPADTPLAVLAYCTVGTVLYLVISTPVVILMSKWIPQLAGDAREKWGKKKAETRNGGS